MSRESFIVRLKQGSDFVLGERVHLLKRHKSIPQSQVERFRAKGALLARSVDRPDQVWFLEPQALISEGASASNLASTERKLRAFVDGPKATIRITKLQAQAMLLLIDNMREDE